MPDFELENQQEGIVCGIDEVGRGPLAGPVVAACVHIPKDIRIHAFISDIKDSKKLSKKKLSSLYDDITTHCIWSISVISPAIIDEINILQASLKAMKNACTSLPITVDTALIDGNRLPKDMPCPARSIVKGDDKSTSIAAASIVAKVTRDLIMQDLDRQHPHYGWAQNAGYPTEQHRKAILKYGITPHHRTTFAPVRIQLQTKCTA